MAGSPNIRMGQGRYRPSVIAQSSRALPGRGSKRGLIVQLKEPLLREGTGNDSCEFLDLYDAFYVFSDPLPIVCTLIYRIDDRTPHLKLRHQSFSAGTYPLSSPSLKSG